MPIEVFDCEQGSPEWLACRLGLLTASTAADMLAKAREPGKGMRVTLLNRLAAERITGEPTESYSNGFLDRGHRLEDEARRLYAMHHDDELHRVGFVKNANAGLGCSPDSLLGERKEDGSFVAGLEIKTLKHELMIETLDRNEPPGKHIAQVQASMLVCGARYWRLMLYSHAKLPPKYFTIERDAIYLANMRKEVDRFNADLDALVKRIESYG